MAVFRKCWSTFVLLLLLVTAAVSRADDPPAQAAGKEPLATRIGQATRAIEAEPRNAAGYEVRARLLLAAGQYQAAIDDFDRLLALEPDRAAAYDDRGSAKFMLGQIDASIEDFDRYLKLRPDQEPWHWKRGISYYYAGRFDDGRRQFEGYQTVDDNDVENAVWRFLCMARGDGVEQARKQLLRIKRDLRIPMSQVYALFAGQALPLDVLAAAKAGQPTAEELNMRLFYAHLYVGLYYEAQGNAAKAREHITAAARQHRIGHYMWNVASVHAQRLALAAGQR